MLFIIACLESEVDKWIVFISYATKRPLLGPLKTRIKNGSTRQMIFLNCVLVYSYSECWGRSLRTAGVIATSVAAGSYAMEVVTAIRDS